MNELEIARKKIDEIDDLLIELFKKRMREVEHVLAYKKANQLKVLDSTRERELKQSKLLKFDDAKLKPYYEMFLDHMMFISKKYQEDHYE
ncbi:MAG: chorismate mutase [Acholeplasma sp.]|nr:chorismate mutase [Acholeplasma sp.]